MLKKKEDNCYLKLKLYMTTKVYYGKDPIPEPVNYITDFYKHLKEGVRARFIFGFSKMWTMGNDHWFCIVVNRLQIDEDSETSILNKMNFADD